MTKKRIRNMSDIQISDLSSILNESLLLSNIGLYNTTDKIQELRSDLKNLPAVLDKSTLDDFVDGKYDISLKQYTDMNTYNTVMNALYGNNSASKFQNTLNILTNSSEDSLANAKTFIDKMKENGMSNNTAVRTYSALQKYSLMSSLGNYSFVKAKA